MVAAGFDAHAGDPIGRSRLSDAFFSGFTRQLRHLSALDNPPLFFALEGGYHQRALAGSIRRILTELAGDLLPMPALSPGNAVIELISRVKAIHAPYGVIHD